MRIDRITVRNFRCFENHTFDLHPQFNVLIGDNASGKTAVLEALAIAAGSWFLGLRGCETRHIRPDDVRLVGQRHGNEVTFEQQFPVEIEAEGVVSDQPTCWKRTLAHPDGRTTYGDALAIKQLAAEADRQVRAGKAATLPVIAYYGTGRLWLPPRDTETRQSNGSKRELSRFEGYRDSIDDRVSSRELTRWLERQDRIAYQEGSESPLYSVVREAMRRMTENAKDVVFDNRRLEVVVHFAGGESQPFGHLSDGQRNVLAFVGDLAVRMARLNPQFGEQVLEETPGIVLVDELDLHLHPKWQRTILQQLQQTFPKCQFIVTTHSPQIISEISPESLILLSYVKGHVIAQQAKQAYGLDVNWILEHLMDVPSRPKPAQDKMDAIEEALELGDFDQAHQLLEELRTLLRGEDGELIRLEASINTLEALLDAEDSEEA